MNAVFLPRERLNEFVMTIQAFGQVLVPTARSAGDVVFAPLTNPDQVVTEYVRTVLPPKKFLLPPVDRLFEFSAGAGYVAADDASGESRVLFGVHACDIHALRLLDLVFLADYTDPYYRSRRRNTAVIGISCHPDGNCFCHSFGADFASDGFDLFLTATPLGYHVRVGTTRGSDIVRAAGDCLRDVAEADLAAYKAYIKERTNEFRRTVDTSALPEILELEHESGLWESLAAKCLGCGSCTMVCPTCHCFRVYDLLELDLDRGRRLRRWDSCLFKDYAMVAGGHNFRPKRSARIRQRLFHKHKFFVERHGLSGCVGCGRCLAACPASVDLTAAIQELRSEAGA